MKSIECYIIQDLLPLYIDHACSEQTAEDIKKHLQSCEKCKKLYEEMSSDICVNLHTPEFNSQTLFYHAKKSVLGIILALAMVISCFAINAGGAWMGGKASLSNLVITALYVIFWSVFSIISRKYEPLIKISLVVSAASFIFFNCRFNCRRIWYRRLYHSRHNRTFFCYSILRITAFYGMDRALCGCNSIVTYVDDLYLGIQA